ncbi:phenylalanine--tRNA ligase subunit alpha, partial [Patescibacteria group bacterium]|nr:phenylalanine--tRNA ligase subunit alpha [Patescibacteria group bacterium]
MLDQLKQNALEEIMKVKELKDLDVVYRRYLGRKGELTKILHSLKDLSEKERKEKGMAINEAKLELEKTIKEKQEEFSFQISKSKKADWFDVTAPGIRPKIGHLHPITLVQRQIEDIFQSMGFSVINGPEVETESYNFDALNI